MHLIFARSVVLFFGIAILLGFNNAYVNSAVYGTDGRDLETWYIHVVNQVLGTGGGLPLLVHCKSADDDLGPHVLQPGEQTTWHFKTAVFKKTKFWCFLNANNQVHKSLDVFWEEKTPWLHDRCYPQDCIWTAKNEGIFIKNTHTNIDELVHLWEEGP